MKTNVSFGFIHLFLASGKIKIKLQFILAFAASVFWLAASVAKAEPVIWGRQKLDALSFNKPFTKISAGARHNIALKNDGTVTGWGDNEFGEIDVPPGLSGVTDVAAGRFHSMALKSDG